MMWCDREGACNECAVTSLGKRLTACTSKYMFIRVLVAYRDRVLQTYKKMKNIATSEP